MDDSVANDHDPVATHWETVTEELTAIATELRNSGWTSVTLHPADVTPLDGRVGDRVGLDVLLPDNEFETVADHLRAENDFDEYDVYRSFIGGVTFVGCVVKSPADEVAIAFPIYYRPAKPAARRLIDRARETGALTCYFRRLGGDTVEFRFEDPDLFVVEESDE